MQTWLSVIDQHCIDATDTNNSDPVLIISHPGIYDRRLIRSLIRGTSPVALVDSQTPDYLRDSIDPKHQSKPGTLCGPVLVDRAWLALQTGTLLSSIQSGLTNKQVKTLDVSDQTTYLGSQRRELRPYWFPALDPKLAQVATETILDASKKDSMDFPALMHAPIEIFLIRHLCKLPISPNQISILCNVVAYTATFLFAQGLLAWGVIVALVVGIIDELDGKQARVKLEETPVGELEHTFDYLYELSWWVSLAYYLTSSGELNNAYLFFLLMFGSDILSKLCRLSVLTVTGLTLDVISPIDRQLRLVTGRRNIYIWLFAIGLITSSGAQAYMGICLWAAASAVAHTLRATMIVLGHRQAATEKL